MSFTAFTEQLNMDMQVSMFRNDGLFGNEFSLENEQFSDLSLKLRGNVFEQEKPPTFYFDAETFNNTKVEPRDAGSLSKENNSDSLQRDHFGMDDLTASGPVPGTYQTSTCQASPKQDMLTNVHQNLAFKVPLKDEFKAHPVKAMPMEGDRLYDTGLGNDETKEETLTTSYASMKSFSSKNSVMDTKESTQTSLYKTPNYKKKSTAMKYTTKHNADKEVLKNMQIKKYGRNLKTRKDVVSKTLLRSLKRFYTDVFSEKYQLGKKDSAEDYLEKVSEFCNHTFETRRGDMQTWGISMLDVINFIAIMVSPNHIKQVLKEDTDLKLYEDFYSCLYQYSHKKLANMLKNKVCGFLFYGFVAGGHLASFIPKCSTMSQYPETYQDMASNFIETILKNKSQCEDFY